MSKTLSLLLICFFVVLGFFFFIKAQPNHFSPNLTTPSPATLSSDSQVQLVISPQPFTISASKSGDINLMLKGKNLQLSVVQFELAYNPLLLQNVTLTPGDFFSSPIVALNIIDTNNGRISYALSSSGNDPKNAGIVATIHFSAINTALSLHTSVTILPKTMIKDINGQSIPLATSEANVTILPFLQAVPVKQLLITQPLHH